MRPRTDTGSVTVELVLLTPVLVLLLLFIVFLGRAGGAIQRVRHAADQGARAAATTTADRMAAVGRAVAVDDLRSNGVDCANVTVLVTPSSSSVRVTVTCLLNAQGTALLGRDVRTVHATSVEVIDRHRGG